jgi:mannitol-1-phosphate/altronate dehydrogenase
MRGYLRRIIEKEVIPYIAPQAEMPPQKFFEDVVQRLRNDKLTDKLERLSSQGQRRMVTYLGESIKAILFVMRGQTQKDRRDHPIDFRGSI